MTAAVPKRKKKESDISELVHAPKQRNAQLEAMAKIASKMEGWKPASQVLTEVKAVPTIFPQFDKATRVGGFPIARIMTIHGPSGEGKTLIALGVEWSFLQRNHFVGHIDAEMTTPITWLKKIMAEQATHPGYLALRPSSFEQAVEDVDRFCTNIAEAKEKEMIAPETSGVVVVDSLRKLVPKNLMKNLMKDGAEKAGVDGMRGRGAQYRAALNAQWMDSLVPLLADTDCAAILIVRETEDTEADAMDRKFGRNYKIGGGVAPIYDSSLTARIERAAWLYQGSDESKETIGERHRVRIWRTKVSGHEDKVTDAFIHTSNGTYTPEGFDRARDVLELAQEMQIVTGEGWLSWKGEKLGQGVNRAVKLLTEKPDMLAELEAQVREGFVIEGAPPVEE